MEDVEDLYSELKALGIPKRYTHNLANSQVSIDEIYCEIFNFQQLRRL